MKKILATVLSLSFILALASCGDTAGTSSVASTASVASSSAVSTVSAPVSSVASSEASSSTESVASTESTVEVEPGGNIAIAGTAIADGVHEDYVVTPGVSIEALNDGDHSSRWQASKKDPETEDNVSWFGIKWNEEQTFDTIVCDWESAHPLEDGFRVEISDDGENWKKVDFSSKRTGTMNETAGVLESDHQIDTITLDKAATTKYVRLVCFTHYVVESGLENAGNAKSPTSCYEIEIYNKADAE